jgi:hypothetical protein
MTGHPVIGYAVWAVLFGGIFAWEGISMVRIGDGFPTLSEALDGVMRYPAGRWILFALWLWFGWHTFVRGWQFMLR